MNEDKENAVSKLNGHFSILANRRETLKDFDSFADTEILEILHDVPTRWLSLLPFTESILHTWKAFYALIFKQTNRLLQIIDQTFSIEDLTEIPQCIKVYWFLQHIVEMLRVPAHD